MEILNNISPLPFYTSLEQQHHRKPYAFGQIYPLISESKWLLPFQFIVKASEVGSEFNADFDSGYDKGGTMGTSTIGIIGINLVDFISGTEVSITADMQNSGLSLMSLGNDLYIFKYPAALPINAISHEGPYYLRIALTSGMIYSDIFISTNNVAGYVKIDYGNTYNLQMSQGHIDFSDDFRFKCYLDTEIGKPEYVFEEEATTRMGYTFVESQISKKTYRFVCVAPEYLCDALRVIRLCNSKRITTKHSYYEPSSFSMNPNWEEQGDLASVECEFETDTIIQNIGNII